MSAVRSTGLAAAGCLLSVVVSLGAGATPALADGVRGQQWYLSGLDLTAVHAVTRGQGVTVAVVDSGVAADHPDLVGSVLAGTETAGARDIDGRGTALASLIAGHGHGVNGADGVLGVAPDARILPVAVASLPGTVMDPNVLAGGIDMAVSKGAKVICVGRGVAPSAQLRSSVDGAADADVLVVAADGDVAGTAFSPWPSSIEGVLTSIALDRSGNVAVPPASHRTSGIAVPGVDLISAAPNGGYRMQTGATGVGILCGAAALVRAAYPGLSAGQVAERLRATADDKGAAGPDSAFGAGVLDLGKALSAPAPSASPSPVEEPAAEPSGVPAAHAATPLLDSRDWHRWLVVIPLVLFLAGLAGYAFRRPVTD
ncbi:S8 family serine peptidase [Hamadaea tsunoensis]|uniref:S8 family serine peptidase n=1 Tax=Hamadaea tsunoensis TaxID=53368 RepID=UPI000413639B|nr:S8 family serine peptidase [Hamadaea tsunoensis]